MFPLRKRAVTWLFLLLSIFSVIKSGETDPELRVVCYYTNWSVYRPGTAKFSPQNINPYLCTHLIYAFGGFTKDNTLKPFDKYQDIEQGGYTKFTGLKSYNKKLKTLLAIGGWNEGSSRFSSLVASSDRRQQFTKSIVKFLRQNHFDGLDLDWEYPAYRDGGKPRDKDNYAQFVQELREEFEREHSKTGRPRLLLTMAVPAGTEYIEKGYDIPKLNKYLDWFNLLSYDYHSAFEPSVNHHSPLYPLEEISEYNYDGELNIDYSIKFYLNAGADREKIVVGIPTYGRSYTLLNDEDTDIGAPADGPGAQGDATREKGYLAYYEICENIMEDDGWTVVQPNTKAMGPYAYKDNQWVGYDDEDIARKKGEYVVANGLGGIMFWSIDNDDFRGICHGRPYPIIEAAKEAMYGASGVDENEVELPSRRQKPNRARNQQNSKTSANRLSSTIKETSGEVSTRGKTIDAQQSRRTATNRRTTTTTKPKIAPSAGRRTTTPEPPTTPDPGSDFKCEDEGFYPHPRDCKKYFWCLDSGPSNLGIVAHQFTCPSGLFFNKATDSCDYTRNVLCHNQPESTTSATTTSTKSSPVTQKTNRGNSNFKRVTTKRTTTTTSTTEAPEFEEEEYEYEVNVDENQNAKELKEALLEEEDPKVIKELIALIKKVGGLEELEKQLRIQEDGTAIIKNSKSDIVTTTPPSIRKSLYDKVLRAGSSSSGKSNSINNFTTTQNRFSTSSIGSVNNNNKDDAEEISETFKSRSQSKSTFSNSASGPQNAGISELDEFKGLLREKPKYTTITRNRQPAAALTLEQTENQFDNLEKDVLLVNSDDELSHEVIDRINKDEGGSPIKYTTQHPQYVNIRRQRPTTISSSAEITADELSSSEEISSTTKSQYVTLNRGRPSSLKTSEQEQQPQQYTIKDEENEYVTSTHKYKTIERRRPTTTEAIPTVNDRFVVKEDIITSEDINDDESQAGNRNTDSSQKTTVDFFNQYNTNTQDTTSRAYVTIPRRTTKIQIEQFTSTTTPANEPTTYTTILQNPQTIKTDTQIDTENPNIPDQTTSPTITTTTTLKTPIVKDNIDTINKIEVTTIPTNTIIGLSETTTQSDQGDILQNNIEISSKLTTDTLTTTNNNNNNNNNNTLINTTTIIDNYEVTTKQLSEPLPVLLNNENVITKTKINTLDLKPIINNQRDSSTVFGNNQDSQNNTILSITTNVKNVNVTTISSSGNINVNNISNVNVNNVKLEESNETVYPGAVSSPRPFGFSRRTRPTSRTTITVPSSTATNTATSSDSILESVNVTEINSTVKTNNKVSSIIQNVDVSNTNSTIINGKSRLIGYSQISDKSTTDYLNGNISRNNSSDNSNRSIISNSSFIISSVENSSENDNGNNTIDNDVLNLSIENQKSESFIKNKSRFNIRPVNRFNQKSRNQTALLNEIKTTTSTTTTTTTSTTEAPVEQSNVNTVATRRRNYRGRIRGRQPPATDTNVRNNLSISVEDSKTKHTEKIYNNTNQEYDISDSNSTEATIQNEQKPTRFVSRRRNRPTINDDDFIEERKSTTETIIRPLRPQIETDLSSLTSFDFHKRGNGQQQRKSTARRVWPQRTTSTTTVSTTTTTTTTEDTPSIENDNSRESINSSENVRNRFNNRKFISETNSRTSTSTDQQRLRRPLVGRLNNRFNIQNHTTTTSIETNSSNENDEYLQTKESGSSVSSQNIIKSVELNKQRILKLKLQDDSKELDGNSTELPLYMRKQHFRNDLQSPITYISNSNELSQEINSAEEKTTNFPDVSTQSIVSADDLTTITFVDSNSTAEHLTTKENILRDIVTETPKSTVDSKRKFILKSRIRVNSAESSIERQNVNTDIENELTNRQSNSFVRLSNDVQKTRKFPLTTAFQPIATDEAINRTTNEQSIVNDTTTIVDTPGQIKRKRIIYRGSRRFSSPSSTTNEFVPQSYRRRIPLDRINSESGNNSSASKEPSSIEIGSNTAERIVETENINTDTQVRVDTINNSRTNVRRRLPNNRLNLRNRIATTTTTTTESVPLIDHSDNSTEITSSETISSDLNESSVLKTKTTINEFSPIRSFKGNNNRLVGFRKSGNTSDQDVRSEKTENITSIEESLDIEKEIVEVSSNKQTTPINRFSNRIGLRRNPIIKSLSTSSATASASIESSNEETTNDTFINKSVENLTKEQEIVEDQSDNKTKTLNRFTNRIGFRRTPPLRTVTSTKTPITLDNSSELELNVNSETETNKSIEVNANPEDKRINVLPNVSERLNNRLGFRRFGKNSTITSREEISKNSEEITKSLEVKDERTSQEIIKPNPTRRFNVNSRFGANASRKFGVGSNSTTESSNTQIDVNPDVINNQSSSQVVIDNQDTIKTINLASSSQNQTSRRFGFRKFNNQLSSTSSTEETVLHSDNDGGEKSSIEIDIDEITTTESSATNDISITDLPVTNKIEIQSEEVTTTESMELIEEMTTPNTILEIITEEKIEPTTNLPSVTVDTFAIDVNDLSENVNQTHLIEQPKIETSTIDNNNNISGSRVNYTRKIKIRKFGKTDDSQESIIELNDNNTNHIESIVQLNENNNSSVEETSSATTPSRRFNPLNVRRFGGSRTSTTAASSSTTTTESSIGQINESSEVEHDESQEEQTDTFVQTSRRNNFGQNRFGGRQRFNNRVSVNEDSSQSQAQSQLSTSNLRRFNNRANVRQFNRPTTRVPIEASSIEKEETNDDEIVNNINSESNKSTEIIESSQANIEENRRNRFRRPPIGRQRNTSTTTTTTSTISNEQINENIENTENSGNVNEESNVKLKYRIRRPLINRIINDTSIEDDTVASSIITADNNDDVETSKEEILTENNDGNKIKYKIRRPNYNRLSAEEISINKQNVEYDTSYRIRRPINRINTAVELGDDEEHVTETVVNNENSEVKTVSENNSDSHNRRIRYKIRRPIKPSAETETTETENTGTVIEHTILPIINESTAIESNSTSTLHRRRKILRKRPIHNTEEIVENEHIENNGTTPTTTGTDDNVDGPQIGRKRIRKIFRKFKASTTETIDNNNNNATTIIAKNISQHQGNDNEVLINNVSHEGVNSNITSANIDHAEENNNEEDETVDSTDKPSVRRGKSQFLSSSERLNNIIEERRKFSLKNYNGKSIDNNSNSEISRSSTTTTTVETPAVDSEKHPDGIDDAAIIDRISSSTEEVENENDDNEIKITTPSILLDSTTTSELTTLESTTSAITTTTEATKSSLEASTKSKLLISRRPYRPTRPSSSAVAAAVAATATSSQSQTSSTEKSTNFGSRGYVRKYSNKFILPNSPSADDVATVDDTASLLRNVKPFSPRPNSNRFRNTFRNDENDAAERIEIKPNYNKLFNNNNRFRNQNVEVENEDEYDDEQSDNEQYPDNDDNNAYSDGEEETIDNKPVVIVSEDKFFRRPEDVDEHVDLEEINFSTSSTTIRPRISLLNHRFRPNNANVVVNDEVTNNNEENNNNNNDENSENAEGGEKSVTTFTRPVINRFRPSNNPQDTLVSRKQLFNRPTFNRPVTSAQNDQNEVENSEVENDENSSIDENANDIQNTVIDEQDKENVVNKPFNNRYGTTTTTTTTVHPASLRFKPTFTPYRPTPSIKKSQQNIPYAGITTATNNIINNNNNNSNSSRTYERKYVASTTETNQQHNQLLEDLDVNALSARNKKIFEKNSKKHTLPKTNNNNISYTNNNNNSSSINQTTNVVENTNSNNELFISNNDDNSNNNNIISINTVINNRNNGNSVNSNSNINLYTTEDYYTLNYMSTSSDDLIQTNDEIHETSTLSFSMLEQEDTTTNDNIQINTINFNDLQELDVNRNRFKHNKSSSGSASSASSSIITTTAKPTTLHHVFAIDYDDLNNNKGTENYLESKLNNSTSRLNTMTDEKSSDVISQRIEKLAEVNRIVEIYSHQEKHKVNKSKSQKQIQSAHIDGPQPNQSDLILEKLPTVDKLGEISRLTLIKLVDLNKDATTTKYISTTQTSTDQQQYLTTEAPWWSFGAGISTLTTENPTNDLSTTQSRVILNVEGLHNTVNTPARIDFTQPHYNEEKHGRNLKLPERFYSVETSTIPLEGLFKTELRDGKKLNVVYAKTLGETINIKNVDINNNNNNNNNDNKNEIIVNIPSISTTKTTTVIPPSTINIESFIENHTTEINAIVREITIDELNKKTTLISTSTNNNNNNNDELNESTQTTETTTTTTSTASSSSTSVTSVTDTTTQFTAQPTVITSYQRKINDVHYVRPLTPLLRPESNESSPLVISIANLDQVILSKIKPSSESTSSTTILAPSVTKNTDIENEQINSRKSIASFGKIRPQFRPGFRRPPNVSAASVNNNNNNTNNNNINNQTKPHRRIIIKSTPSNEISDITESSPHLLLTTIKSAVYTNRRRTRPSTTTTTPSPSPTLSSSSSASSASSPSSVQQQSIKNNTTKVFLRRKFGRPNGGDTRRFTTTSTTTTKAPLIVISDTDDSSTKSNEFDTDAQKYYSSKHPYFRRRFGYNTTRPTITSNRIGYTSTTAAAIPSIPAIRSRPTTTRRTATTTTTTPKSIVTDTNNDSISNEYKNTDDFDVLGGGDDGSDVVAVGGGDDNNDDDNDDQEIESSIQDSKFINSRFNQIGEPISDDIVEALTAISKAPLPVTNKPTSTSSKTITSPSASKPTAVFFINHRNQGDGYDQDFDVGKHENGFLIDNQKLIYKSESQQYQDQQTPKPQRFTTRATRRPNASRRTSVIPRIEIRRTTFAYRPTIVTTPQPSFTQNAPSRDYLRKPVTKPKPFEKSQKILYNNGEEGDDDARSYVKGRQFTPTNEYDYYDEGDVQIIGKSNSKLKVILHDAGIIECLDQGNFPHPLSCRKFISCAKMETGGVVGWEYTCPKGLSFDPVGGLCNWAAGLGCKE